MVGIVVVSHSRALAEELVKLASQVTSIKIPIAFSGGAGPEHREFGTDALDILDAVQSVFSEDGVLILMDLGSAILSAETAIEFLPDEMQSRVRLSPCPLVEGTIAAAVQSSLGSDLDAVDIEARQALWPKTDHLGQAAPGSPTLASPPDAGIDQPTERITLTLNNEHGLHARPAARFVRLASSFDAEILVSNPNKGKGPVPSRSLNALATLGAVRGDSILISASGAQAIQAIQALRALVDNNFGEKLEDGVGEAGKIASRPRQAETMAAPGTLLGTPVVDGIAVAPGAHLHTRPAAIPDNKSDDPQVEWDEFQLARETVRKEIEIRRSQVSARFGESQASIFEAHGLILEDPILLESVRSGIFAGGLSAPRAWDDAIRKIAGEYRSLDDPYLQQRALDVEDVGDQILNRLVNEGTATSVDYSNPVILIAQDLTPTQTAQLDLEKIQGLITIGGGATSHSAILARAQGIPYISGADPAVAALAEGVPLGMDSFEGVVYIDPGEEVRRGLEARRKDWQDRRADLRSTSRLPAITIDGRRLEVQGNVGGVHDAEAASRNGAEGIGLLRTEFLFISRTTPPSEEEQYEILDQIAGCMPDYPITVRTLDVGGDKPLPFIEQEVETNPYLGVRAIRLSLHRSDLFQAQLKAVLRAGDGRQVRIMFPMVTGVEEIVQAKEHLETAHAVLEAEKRPHRWPIETGIMVETPAAALLSPILASAVDFFSIGTNDLTQYTLAAERGNPRLAGYQDGLNPAVLRLIEMVVEAAHRHGKWVGVCGELAGDLEAVPILLGLGVDELSVNPAGIPAVKSLVRKVNNKEAARAAARARGADSAAQSRGYAAAFLDGLP